MLGAEPSRNPLSSIAARLVVALRTVELRDWICPFPVKELLRQSRDARQRSL
jgi:hypothetical protein